MHTTVGDVALTTIDEAIKPYRGVTVRMVRRWILAGRLAATRVGKSYIVDPKDLAELLRPRLRQPAPRRARESETARIQRQLAGAGIG